MINFFNLNFSMKKIKATFVDPSLHSLHFEQIKKRQRKFTLNSKKGNLTLNGLKYVL